MTHTITRRITMNHASQWTQGEAALRSLGMTVEPADDAVSGEQAEAVSLVLVTELRRLVAAIVEGGTCRLCDVVGGVHKQSCPVIDLPAVDPERGRLAAFREA